MALENQLNWLIDHQITHSRFISKVLNGGMLGGVPIGEGECKGVILSANHFELYSDNAQSNDNIAAKFYYGDSEQQSKEFLFNTNEALHDTNQRDSGFIPCTDLSQVWVRLTDNIAPVQIEIHILD